MAFERATKRERPAKSLKARAVALLARREYSRTELRDKLVGRGNEADVGDADVDAVLDELAALGYLSDARFAKALVQKKSGAFSRRSIGATLKARGVSVDVAAEAIEGSEVDDQDAMVTLWRRRFGQAPRDDREKGRQVRFLQSRGFALSAIFKLLRNPPTDEGSD